MTHSRDHVTQGQKTLLGFFTEGKLFLCSANNPEWLLKHPDAIIVIFTSPHLKCGSPGENTRGVPQLP